MSGDGCLRKKNCFLLFYVYFEQKSLHTVYTILVCLHKMHWFGNVSLLHVHVSKYMHNYSYACLLYTCLFMAEMLWQSIHEYLLITVHSYQIQCLVRVLH